MAFFGLTALGPQDSFELSLVDFSYLQVFTDDDVKKAFKAADKNQRCHLDIHEVEGFLNELYQGTPKACDLARFSEKARKSIENNRLSLDDIRSVMDQLKEEVEKEKSENKWKRGSGSDFSSNTIFREKMRNHEKMRGPRERYADTITAMQEHGWRDQLDFNRQNFVKNFVKMLATDTQIFLRNACHWRHLTKAPGLCAWLAPVPCAP